MENIFEGRVGPFLGVENDPQFHDSLSEEDISDEDSISESSVTPELPSSSIFYPENEGEPQPSVQQKSPTEVLSSNPAPTLSGRFSKDPSERQRLLSVRKRQLLDIAKRRFTTPSGSD